MGMRIGRDSRTATVHAYPLRSDGGMGCFRLGSALSIVLLSCAAAASAAGGQWLFKPTGGDGTTDHSAITVDDSAWQAVELPHRTWDETQPRRYVYGWYRYHFRPAKEFAGRDLVLKLGIIDDVDETYCNGVRIGGTGSFPPDTASAYNVDREYIIPAARVRFGGDNVLAVKVYDTIGTGGLLGAPRLGYRLTPSDVWLFKGAGQDQEADYAAPELDDSEWEKVPMPDDGWDKRQPEDNVIGWYRLHFSVPEVWGKLRLILDLGLILDADETYLNGEWIALTGSFPPEPFSAAGDPRLYELPSDCIKYGEDNVLAIKVFNDYARGGIWGRPAFLAFAQDTDITRSDTLDHAIRLRHATYYEDALRLLTELGKRAETDAMRADILDELTVVYGALGRDDDALAAFSQLLRGYPDESCSRDAVKAVCVIQQRRGGLSDGAVCLGADRLTQGRWRGVYGNDGFVLCAMGGDSDVLGVPGRYMFGDPYCRDRPTVAPRDAHFWYSGFRYGPDPTDPCHWFGAAWGTADVRALTDPITRRRAWTCWDDKGEAHPFDNAGPDLGAEVRVPEGWWRCSAYLVDWDWRNTWHARQYGIVLLDDNEEMLAAFDTGKFGQGVWVRFAVRGPRTATWRICKNRSICAIVSGLFLDKWRPPAALDGVGLSERETGREPLAEQYGLLAAGERPTVRQEVEARRLATELDKAAQNAPGLTEAQGWMLWQLACEVSPYDPAAIRGLRAWVTALGSRPRQQVLRQMATVADALSQRSQYYLAHQVTDERDAIMLAGGELGVTDVEAFTREVMKWSVVADEYALARFDRLVTHVNGMKPEEAARLLGAAAQCVADDPDESFPIVEGEFRPLITARDHRPTAIPSPARRIADWFAVHDPALARAYAAGFFETRGNRAIKKAREAYQEGKWPRVISKALGALEAAKLVPDLLDVNDTHVRLLRAVESSADIESTVTILEATGTDAPVTPREALVRGSLYAKAGLHKQAQAVLEALRDQLQSLPPGHCAVAFETLARSCLRQGDVAGAERAMRELLAIAREMPGVARGNVALAAYRWLSQLYIYTGRTDELQRLETEVEKMLYDDRDREELSAEKRLTRDQMRRLTRE